MDASYSGFIKGGKIRLETAKKLEGKFLACWIPSSYEIPPTEWSTESGYLIKQS